LSLISQTLPLPTRTDTITLNTGEGHFFSAVIDGANGYAYFGTDTTPGRVVKVDVNPSHTFTRTGGITLNTGENGLRSAVIDSANGFAYFGTYYTSPGKVVKVDVNQSRTFTRTDGITLNTGEGKLISAVLDTANGYAYFGASTSPVIVSKIDLGTTYTLTVNTAGTGAGSVTDTLASGTLILPSVYAHGSVVTLTATANVGSYFVRWSGDVTGTINPITITMDADKTVTATFTLAGTNQSPVANAGVNQTIKSASLVTLDGSGSSDPDNNLPLTYGWTQTGGSPVALSSVVISRPTFTASKVVTQTATLTFTLVVTDSLGLVSVTPAQVAITVEPYRVFLPVVLR
jgi:Divergent InlB B-repeat domain/K319L-like, PKD domain